MTVHLPVIQRPRTRGECADVPRPCPFVGCRQNLFLEVKRTGRIALASSWKEPGDVDPEWSCALDVADRGGSTLLAIGQAWGYSRQWIEIVEKGAIEKLRASPEASELGETDDGPDMSEHVFELSEDEESDGRKGRTRGVDFEGAMVSEGKFTDPLASDENVCARVWRIFARESTERGFDARSKASKAATRRRQMDLEETPVSGRMQRIADVWLKLNATGQPFTILDVAREADVSGTSDKAKCANANAAIYLLRKKAILPPAPDRKPALEVKSAPRKASAEDEALLSALDAANVPRVRSALVRMEAGKPKRVRDSRRALPAREAEPEVVRLLREQAEEFEFKAKALREAIAVLGGAS